MNALPQCEHLVVPATSWGYGAGVGLPVCEGVGVEAVDGVYARVGEGVGAISIGAGVCGTCLSKLFSVG